MTAGTQRSPSPSGSLQVLEGGFDPRDMAAVRRRYLKRWQALKMDRNSFDAHWKELGRVFRPRRPRFNTKSDIARAGSQRNDGIINSTPIRAVNVLSSGMMAGISAPSRPWFRLTIPDPQLAESSNVRLWLDTVEERIRMAFLKSNVYKALQEVYVDLSWVHTAVLFLDEDERDGLRAYVFAPGQYALGADETLRVDTLFRETALTVGQLVRKFGKDAVSPAVQDKWRQGNLEERTSVLHVVEPNLDFVTGRLGARGMPISSLWMELSSTEHNFGILRQSGYREQPFMAPRWMTNSEDTYGTGPAMDCLGDANSLQLFERKKLVAIEKVVDPPMRGSESLRKNGRASLIPGDVTYLEDGANRATFEPAHLVDPRAIQEARLGIAEIEQRLKEGLYNDLFLLMTESDRRDITAREVEERHAEKLEQLGPVLENLQDELLDPLIERAFGILYRRGDLPPAPPELQGVPLRIQHVSILAQAQKLVEAQPIERVVAFVGSLAQASGDPSVFDKLNKENAVEEYANLLGVKASLVNSDDVVQALRQARAQAQQQAQAGEQAVAASTAAKNLGAVDMSRDNVLGRMANVYAGGNAVG
ncbi:MAG TPA: portal protein [Anaeromyxobacteraceae bacterium]|nr:portal protein [Anaeromyxobacteraceae bacterium]